MSYTGNPEHDADMRDMEHEEWLFTRPICYLCGNPIQTEKALKIKHVYICMDCVYEHTVFMEEEINGRN